MTDVAARPPAQEGNDRAVFDTIRAPAAIVDDIGTIVAVNRAWEDAADAVGADLSACGVAANYLSVCRAAAGQFPEARAIADAIIAACEGRSPAHAIEYACHEARRRRWFEAQVLPLDGRPGYALITHVDVTERRRTSLELSHQTTHDQLTGLANRTLFVERVRRASAEGPLAVLLLELDDFKLVNDGLGHEHGDELLVQVAGRLVASVRPGDTVARVGGDEFAVLACGISTAEATLRLAASVQEGLAAPFRLEARTRHVNASIGARHAEVPGRGGAEGILRDAMAALHEAMRTGRGGVALFSPETKAALVRRVELEEDLRVALAAGELRVHYQPMVDLMTGKTTGVEALLRWTHPERGPISPGEFIPIAEASGLIRPIGLWVLEDACARLAAWDSDDGARGLQVSVNVSGVQLHDTAFARHVAAALVRYDLDPARLCLELTEGTLMDLAPHALDVVHDLQRLGVRLAVDDFGTGQSSLAALRNLPVNVLKVDRRFVHGLGASVEDSAVVQAILGLAAALGLRVVSEGVEEHRQASELSRIGARMAQGFLFSAALEPDDVPRFCRAPASVDAPAA